MKAEEQKDVEISALERWLRNTSQSLSQKSLYSYVFIIGLLILVVLAFGWWQGLRSGKKAYTWIELETLDNREKLKSFAETHRGELPGMMAQLRLARASVGTDGLQRLGTRDSEQRKLALSSLVEGRKLYLDAIPQLKDHATLQTEAWLGAARAEEALIGATLGESSESLGKADKAIEYYEKALALMGDGEEGKKLKEYVTSFKAAKDTFTKNYTDFHTAMKPLAPLKFEEPKKDEVKKDEVKKEEPKKDEVKKEEPKKDEKK